MFHPEPIIIIGCPRSGTSTVSRILHEKLGVVMGTSWMPPDWKNPMGYYEDKNLVLANNAFLRNEIYFEEFMARITRAILAIRGKAEKENKLWGFKDGRVSLLLGLYIPIFQNPTYVLCKRDQTLIKKSLIKCYPHHNENMEEAGEHYISYQTVINRLCGDKEKVVVDFEDKRLTDDKVESILREGLQEWLN